MKYLHIKLCGKAFPHLDKAIKNKKKKNPLPHWDEPLKAFHEKKMKDRLILMSSQNHQLRAKLAAGSCTSQRSARVWGFHWFGLPLPDSPLYRAKVFEYNQVTWGIQVQTYLNQKTKDLNPVLPSLRWVFLPLGSCGFGVDFDVHPCTHHFSSPLIFPMCTYLLSTLSTWTGA